jgi:tape measure domain-containing protein
MSNITLTIDVVAPNASAASAKAVTDVEKQVHDSNKRIAQSRTALARQVEKESANEAKSIISDILKVGNEREKADKKAQSEVSRASKRRTSEEKAAAREIERINRETARQAEKNAKTIEHAEKHLQDARIREWKRGLKETESMMSGAGGGGGRLGNFSSSDFGKAGNLTGMFGGGGGGAAAAGAIQAAVVGAFLVHVTGMVRGGIDQAIAAGVTAADYQRTKIALGSIIGSTSEANLAIAKLETTATNTPGLTFKNALEGYSRLRAVQFGARDAERALVGLSKVKVLSGGTEEDLQAVLVNFAQIRSMGKLTGDELRETLSRFPYFAQILEKAFGTISTEKIGELQLSSEEFFERIFAQMDKMPAVAGGASEAWAKLNDEFYKAQIAFGTPFLEGATKVLQDFTGGLNDSRDTLRVWGQVTADQMVTAYDSFIKFGQSVMWVNTQLNNTASFLGYDKFKELAAEVGGQSPLAAGAGGGRSITSRGDLQRQEGSTGAYGDWLTNQQKQNADSEIRLYKETQKKIEDEQKIALQNLDTYYVLRQATIAGGLRVNSDQELEYQRNSNAIQAEQSAKRLAILQNEINRNRALNEKLILSYKPEDQAKIRTIKELEISGKIAALAKESASAALDEANRKRQILELEQRIATTRRQAAIEAKALQLQSTQFGSDNQLFDAQRALARGSGGFESILSITQQSFEAVRRITREQYELQLEDTSLTAEQRTNLIKRMYQSERELAERNRRDVLQIDDDKTNRQIDNINRAFSQFRTIKNENAATAESFFGNLLGGELSGSDFAEKIALIAKVRTEFEKLTDTRIRAEGEYARLSSQLASDDTEKLSEDDRQKLIKAKQLAETSAIAARQAESSFKVQNNLSEALKEYANVSDTVLGANFNLLESFEKIQRAMLGQTGLKAVSDLQITLRNQIQTRDKASAAGNFAQASSMQEQIDITIKQLSGAQAQLEAKIQEFNKSTVKGIQQYISNTSPFEKLRIVYEANQGIWLDTKKTYQNIIALESEYYKNSDYWAMRQKEVRLETIREIWEADQNAVLDSIEAQEKLADAQNIHLEQIRGRFLSHLAEQKTATDIFADALISAYDRAGSSIDKALDKVGIGKVPFIGDLAKGFARNALTQITSKLFPQLDKLTGGMAKTGNPVLDENVKQTNYLKSIDAKLGGSNVPGANLLSMAGGNPLSILSGINGGSLGGLGGGGGSRNWTSMINPNLGASPDANWNPAQASGGGGGGLFGSGGILGSLKGMFGPQKNLLTGKMSSMAGVGAGIGTIATMAGGMIGGKWGNLLSMAGTGAQIGSMFGPWGTAIGAGVGALIGAFGFLGGGAEKKLRKAAESAYSPLKIKDTSVLKQLKAIGESTFGKGQAGAHASETVLLEPARELLLGYAESSGQDTSKLEGDNYFAESNPKNHYSNAPVPRAPVVSAGSTSSDSYSGSSARPAGSSSGKLTEIMAFVGETVALLHEKIESIPVGEFVGIGLKQNPHAAAEAVESRLGDDPGLTDSFRRKMNV